MSGGRAIEKRAAIRLAAVTESGASRHLPLVIVNPAAGGGAAGRDWNHAAPVIRSEFGPFACLFTHGPREATRMAEAEAYAGRSLIITFGGDGTVSEIADGILRAGSGAELGLLPHGTGADFLRTLGIPARIGDAARALRHSRPARIDVGRVRFVGASGEQACRHFVNAASFGLSGEVARDMNRSGKRLPGWIGFASATLRAAAQFSAPGIWLQVDAGPARRVTTTLVALANGRYFGGGMQIAPKAHIADGLLDIVVVQKLSFLKILTHGPRLYSGTHLGLPEVQHARIGRVMAHPANPEQRILVEVDGETPGYLPATFEVVPSALTVRVPRST
jgi:diacylglycerol kinase (ATP)